MLKVDWKRQSVWICEHEFRCRIVHQKLNSRAACFSIRSVRLRRNRNSTTRRVWCPLALESRRHCLFAWHEMLNLPWAIWKESCRRARQQANTIVSARENRMESLSHFTHRDEAGISARYSADLTSWLRNHQHRAVQFLKSSGMLLKLLKNRVNPLKHS